MGDCLKQVKKQHLELDMEQQTGFQIRKGVHHIVTLLI